MTDGDWVLLILTLGAVGIGLLSMLIGKLVEWYDWLTIALHHRWPPSSVSVEPHPYADADERTDERTDGGSSALEAAIATRQLDVIKRAIIDSLLLSGADVEIVRKVIKGENAALGVEVAEAKQRLGIEEPPRMLKVSDAHGPRMIPFDDARRA